MLKLTIELVPSSCWYSNVRSHVSLATWERLKKQVFAKAGHRCQICGERGSKHPLECHEVWKYDDHRCVQSLHDLISLCPRCHEVKHFGLAMQRGRIQDALKWFCEVNQVSPGTATNYLTKQLSIHAIRSQFSWSLDLRLLANRHNVHLGQDHRELHH